MNNIKNLSLYFETRLDVLNFVTSHNPDLHFRDYFEKYFFFCKEGYFRTFFSNIT